MTRDPLHGIDDDATRHDGRRWEALLAAVAADGAQWDPWGLYGLLRGLRALGASLEPVTRGWRLDPPEGMTRDDLRAEIGEHADRLAAILRHAPALTMTDTAAALTEDAEILEIQNAFQLA